MGQHFVLTIWVLVDCMMPVRYFYQCIVRIVCIRGKFFTRYKKYSALGAINKDFVAVS